MIGATAPSTYGAPPEAFPVTSDEAFGCYLEGTDAPPVVYEATTLENDGYLRSLGPTAADGGWLKAFLVRTYDHTEYVYSAVDNDPQVAPEGTPDTVYVSGRQIITLEWAEAQPAGAPVADPIAATFTVSRMEVRDAAGVLVDSFSYRVMVDETGVTVLHQRGLCGDFVLVD